MADPTTPVFRIGLVMAGAVSAGAYTAGVVDFLMEALETWDRRKRAGEPGVPSHRVRIDVITGASAGSIASAVLASSLRDAQYPDLRPAAERAPTKLFETWVELVDITKLLALDDLDKTAVADPRPWYRRLACCLLGCGEARPKPGEVRSLLNSDALDRIAETVLDVPWTRTAWPAYINDPLQLYLTVTNLRGVPYAIHFTGPTGNIYGMSQHADFMAFTLRAEAKEVDGFNGDQMANTADLELGPIGAANGLAGNWKVLGQSALASGAFPVGLSARILERTGTLSYDQRLWPIPQSSAPAVNGECVCTTLEPIQPDWPPGLERETFRYEFTNVDGGVANNEPFEMARRYLAGGQHRLKRGAKDADATVLMVDPFPENGCFDCNEVQKIGLLPVLQRLMGAVIKQLRFKTEELELAKRNDVHSRWIIAPKRSGDHPPIASASLGAFGGFLSWAFRNHDYHLGRRNCQRFLQSVLMLHEDNPVFSGHWTEGARGGFGWYTEDARPDGADPTRVLKGRTEPGRYLPVIPLFGDCAVEMPEPEWPRNAYTDFKGLGRQVKRRLNRLTDRLIDTSAHECIDRALLKLGWRLIQGRRALTGKDSLATSLIIGKIKANLKQSGLLD